MNLPDSQPCALPAETPPKPRRPRLFYLDLIRSVALVSILIIHFNATVTGYFAYPSKLFGSTLPFNIYLGDFGSSLFFIVSGASLAYTAARDFSPLAFYKKRARAVYPMFWLAWALCFSVRFFTRPGSFAGARSVTIVLTALGLDNFAVAAGWVGMDFACVGEWFLGSILFLYLLFPPLLKLARGGRAARWGGFAAVAAVGVAVHLLGWDARLVAIHLPEFFFGMLFVTLSRRGQLAAFAGSAGALAVLALSRVADTKILCAAFSAAVFAALALAGSFICWGPAQRFCALLGKYSYAVFLTHHVLIQRMVMGFDLSAISRRDTALLFGSYLVLTALLSAGLYRLDAAVRAGAAAIWHRNTGK